MVRTMGSTERRPRRQAVLRSYNERVAGLGDDFAWSYSGHTFGRMRIPALGSNPLPDENVRTPLRQYGVKSTMDCTADCWLALECRDKSELGK
jgi:hypothetical protein